MIIPPRFFDRLRINDDIVALMHTLDANGIGVFVSTASLDDVVRVFASDPTLGDRAPTENMHA